MFFYPQIYWRWVSHWETNASVFNYLLYFTFCDSTHRTISSLDEIATVCPLCASLTSRPYMSDNKGQSLALNAYAF